MSPRESSGFRVEVEHLDFFYVRISVDAETNREIMHPTNKAK